jgi:protein farnesyltransferase/geranylgeranyltransferase type-1 subunit alpha
MPYSTQAAFVELYVADAVEEDVDRVLDLENPPPSEGAQLPCPAAIEFMADVNEARGKEGISEAVKVRPFLMFIAIQSGVMRCHCHQLWRSLAHTHDTIRKRYVVKFAAPPPIELARHEDRYWEFRIRDAVANTSAA